MLVSTRTFVAGIESVIEFLPAGIGRSAKGGSWLQAGQEPLPRRLPSLLGRGSRWLGLAPLVPGDEGHQHRDILAHSSGPLRELHLSIPVYARDRQHRRHALNLLPVRYDS